MWNKVSANRIIDLRQKRQAQRRHAIALANIKSSINNASPQHCSFLYSRPKAKIIQLQRQQLIEHDNNLLVEKMMRTSSYVRPSKDVQLKESLNSIYRGQMERTIDEGNQKLVRRLQSAKSQYRSVHSSMRNYHQYKSNLAHSRMDPFYDFENPPRKHSRPFSAKR